MDFLHDLQEVIRARGVVLQAIRDAWCALIDATNHNDGDAWVAAFERLEKEEARLDEWQIVW